MNGKISTALLLILFLSFDFFANPVMAQTADCIFKDSIFVVDFGSEQNTKEFNLRSLKEYRQSFGACPDDGYYSYTSATSNCFLGDWITLATDHTPNDVDGRMMLVNASERASDFFILNFEGFKSSATYEFAVWFINVCKVNSGCPPLPPDIRITLQTPGGKMLADFRTGVLPQSSAPAWKKFFGSFTMPASETIALLRMRNLTNGGCGNDFAMDDITFRECYPPPPVIPEPTPASQPEKKVQPVLKKNAIEIPRPEIKPVKKNIQVINKIPERNDSVLIPGILSKAKINSPLPSPLSSRENLLVKKIKAENGEIMIELYDNGEVDGDTISVFDNNEIIVSRQALSERAIRFKIKIDDAHPVHELVMVAENLGSIPPNTSLMVVTANKKRYEVFISSSEQKNAKVIISKIE